MSEYFNAMKIKKGDAVRVRLSSGEVADASYERPSLLEKCHIVDVRGAPYLAIGGRHGRRGVALSYYECRFVGPTPVVKKQENSNE